MNVNERIGSAVLGLLRFVARFVLGCMRGFDLVRQLVFVTAAEAEAYKYLKDTHGWPHKRKAAVITEIFVADAPDNSGVAGKVFWFTFLSFGKRYLTWTEHPDEMLAILAAWSCFEPVIDYGLLTGTAVTGPETRLSPGSTTLLRKIERPTVPAQPELVRQDSLLTP